MPAQPRPDRILHGSIPVETLRFGLPIAAGMGLQTVFNLVDAYIVSRLTPDVAGPALGAIGICDQLTAIGTILSYGLTTASAALIAQAHGRGDKAEVRRIAWQSMLAVTALSILFGLLSIVLAGPIVAGAVGAKGKVSELGTEYLRVIGGGSFSIYFLFQLTGIQRALGSAKTPVALLVLSNVLNLFLAVLPRECGAVSRRAAVRGAAAFAAGDASAYRAELDKIVATVKAAEAAGVGVNAGHDLTVENLGPLVREAPQILEVSIGHHLTVHALEVGMEQAVKDYLRAVAGG